MGSELGNGKQDKRISVQNTVDYSELITNPGIETGIQIICIEHDKSRLREKRKKLCSKLVNY